MAEPIVFPVAPGNPYPLGRSHVVFDERSKNFPARGALFAEDAPLVTKTWRRPRAYDQGQTSECTCFALWGMINTAPNTKSLAAKVRKTYNPDTTYHLAQTMDEWPGENYDGTSVLGAFKAGQQEGFVKEYRWCFGLQDVLQTLSHHGPVEIGITWYNSMFHPGARGVLAVNAASGVAGGHAIELHGVDVRRKQVVGTNSWGTSWGDRGRFRLSWDDLDTLLKDNGEAGTFA